MGFKRPNILRPPSERNSYFLPLTRGCSNNTCAFCSFYGSKLEIRDIDRVKEEIDALDLYLKHDLRLSNIHPWVYELAPNMASGRVFLQDGDALVYPFSKLVEVLLYMNERFPDLERIAAYATPQDILRRTIEDLKVLRELKLAILYMGVESGDDEVLQMVNKGVNRVQIAEAGRKVKEAGITISATVILGLGGVEGSERHSLETARILSEIDPEFGGALTLIPVPGTPIYQKVEQGTFNLLSPVQSLEELRRMVEKSIFTNCFFSSMHPSNYFSVRGILPRDKEKMIRQLDEVLERNDASMLRPEFLRRL